MQPNVVVSCRGSAGDRVFYTCAFEFEEPENAGANFVADDADFFDGLVLWIAERPIVAAKAGDVGAVVTAAHGDEELGVARELFSEFLRPCAGEVDADFLHYGEHFGVNPQAGIGTGGDGLGLGAIGELIKERGRHLGAAGVVHTGEDHFEHGWSHFYEQQVGPQQDFAGTAEGLMA